jgi:death-on-curing protein
MLRGADLIQRRRGSRVGNRVHRRSFTVSGIAVAQPWMTFGGTDLYPSMIEKSAALCFSLVKNHPFVDGNKRVGHAAMETLLVLNGFQIDASTDEQEQLLLALAAGQLSREDLVGWLREQVREV